MKFKKCIMTLICALSVLLSSFAFDFESEAARQEIGVGKTYTQNVSMGRVFMSPESIASSGYLYEEDGVYTYYEYGYGTGTVNANLTTTIGIPIYEMNSNNHVVFDENYDSIRFSMDLYIKPSVSTNAVDTSNPGTSVLAYHTLEQMYVVGYGQKVPVDFYLLSDGSYQIAFNHCFEKTTSSNATTIPYNFYFVIESRVNGSFVHDTPLAIWLTPKFDLNYGIYKRIAIFNDENSKDKQYNDAIVNELKDIERIDIDLYNKLVEMWQNQEDLELWLVDALALLHADNNETNYQLASIREELTKIYDALMKSSDVDKNSTNSFTQDSNNQSDKLNQFNEQNKMDKIDVDSASSSVDANIDGNAISNYGVVLSSITGQGKVVQLMLIVLSVGLVSYVLFGKR